MKRIFADTYYFLALLNTKDAGHAAVQQFSQTHNLHLVTTTWVLTELADGLSQESHRLKCVRFLHQLRTDRETTIIPPSFDLFDRGLSLYEARADKNWSLTDCISFVVMKQHHLKEALTADHHFEQAGFIALLK